MTEWIWVEKKEGPFRAWQVKKENLHLFTSFISRFTEENFLVGIRLNREGKPKAIEISNCRGYQRGYWGIGDWAVWVEGKFPQTFVHYTDKEFKEKWRVVKEGEPWTPHRFGCGND